MLVDDNEAENKEENVDSPGLFGDGKRKEDDDGSDGTLHRTCAALSSAYRSAARRVGRKGDECDKEALIRLADKSASNTVVDVDAAAMADIRGTVVRLLERDKMWWCYAILFTGYCPHLCRPFPLSLPSQYLILSPTAQLPPEGHCSSALVRCYATIMQHGSADCV